MDEATHKMNYILNLQAKVVNCVQVTLAVVSELHRNLGYAFQVCLKITCAVYLLINQHKFHYKVVE